MENKTIPVKVQKNKRGGSDRRAVHSQSIKKTEKRDSAGRSPSPRGRDQHKAPSGSDLTVYRGIGKLTLKTRKMFDDDGKRGYVKKVEN